MNENFKVIRSWDLKALGYVVGFLLGRDGFGYKNPKARPKYAVLFGMNAKSSRKRLVVGSRCIDLVPCRTW